jgi:hypothetical protein
MEIHEKMGDTIKKADLTRLDNRSASAVNEIFSVLPQMVDFGLEQGLSDFETASIVGLCRGFQMSENAAPDQKVPFVGGY